MRQLQATARLFALLCAIHGGVASAQNTGIVSANVDVNYAPTAVSQIVGLRNFNVVTLTLVGLDANKDQLTFAIVSGPSLGSLGLLDTASGEVTYTPVNGSQTTDSFTFSVSDGSATSDPATVTILAPPMATVSPVNLNFGNQGIGSPSAAKTVTVKNSGAVVLNVTNVFLGGSDRAEFGSVAPALPLALAPGKSVKVSVSFLPGGLGTKTSSLTVMSDAAASPQYVSLKGIGVEQLSVSVSVLNFGKIVVGSSSAAKNVTLTNNTSGVIAMGSIVPSTNFSFTTTCASEIPAKGKCLISVTFAPTSKGTHLGSLTISDGASNSPQIVTLKGTGS